MRMLSSLFLALFLLSATGALLSACGTEETTTTSNNSDNNNNTDDNTDNTDNTDDSSNQSCTADYMCSGDCWCTAGPKKDEYCTDPDDTTDDDSANCYNFCEVCTTN